MKNWKLLLVSAVVFLAGAQPFFAQSKAEKKAAETAAVKELIKSRRYKIEVNRAVPMNGPSKNLTTRYSLEIKGDSVSSYLPYFGQAYNLPYGGGKGLIFEAPITGYKLSFNKKDVAAVKFKSRTEEDYFSYLLQVYPNGSATIHVTPVNRQSITFYGELVADDD